MASHDLQVTRAVHHFVWFYSCPLSFLPFLFCLYPFTFFHLFKTKTSRKIHLFLPFKSHCLTEKEMVSNITIGNNLINLYCQIFGVFLDIFLNYIYKYVYSLVNISPNFGINVFVEMLDMLRFLYENIFSKTNILC